MSRDYLLGLGTLPALFLLLCLLYVLLHSRSGEWAECQPCDWRRAPKRFEPWWVWVLRHRLSWQRHLQVSAPCRAHTNLWLVKRHEYQGRGGPVIQWKPARWGLARRVRVG